MPLHLENGLTGELLAVQAFDRPAVYLDHWAIRRMSEVPSLGERFVNALKRANGTLVLWALNFGEFATAEPHTVAKAEDFLEQVVPNVYFASVGLDLLISAERTPRSADDQKLPLPQDLEFLRFVAQRVAPNGSFSLRGLIELVADHAEDLQQTIHETAASMVDKVALEKSNKSFIAKARVYKPSANVPRSQVIIAEMMRSALLDTNHQFKKNDAIDLLHAVAPVSRCDFVLLDGDWESRVNQARGRLAKLQPPIELAKCFSERRDGVTAFFTALERWSVGD